MAKDCHPAAVRALMLGFDPVGGDEFVAELLGERDIDEGIAVGVVHLAIGEAPLLVMASRKGTVAAT